MVTVGCGGSRSGAVVDGHGFDAGRRLGGRSGLAVDQAHQRRCTHGAADEDRDENAGDGCERRDPPRSDASCIAAEPEWRSLRWPRQPCGHGGGASASHDREQEDDGTKAAQAAPRAAYQPVGTGRCRAPLRRRRPGERPPRPASAPDPRPRALDPGQCGRSPPGRCRGPPVLGDRSAAVGRARATPARATRGSSPGIGRPPDDQDVAAHVVARLVATDGVEHDVEVVPPWSSEAGQGQHQHVSGWPSGHGGAHRRVALRIVHGGEPPTHPPRRVERAAARAAAPGPRPRGAGATPTSTRATTVAAPAPTTVATAGAASTSIRAPSRTTPPPGTCDANQPTPSGRAQVSNATAMPTAQHVANARAWGGNPRQRAARRPSGRQGDDHDGGQPAGDAGPRERHHVAVPDTAEGQGRNRRWYVALGLEREGRRSPPLTSSPSRRGGTRRPARVRWLPGPTPKPRPSASPGPPTAPATRATAVTTPALALSDPRRPPPGEGGREQTRQPPALREVQYPRQAGPADQHGPVTDQQPLDHERTPLVADDHGEPADHRQVRHESRGAEASGDEGTEEDDLLQRPCPGRWSRAPPPRRPRAPPGAGWWPGRGSRTAG